MLTRRQLLTTTAGTCAVAGTSMLAACTGEEPLPRPRPTDVPPLNPANWDSVRAQFALRADGANFSTFVFASHPATVHAAIEAYRAGLDADPYGFLDAHEAQLEQAVSQAAAAYLGTAANQIAFTDSTTMGLGLLYSGLRLRPGDEVLTSEHDFYATHESLRLRSHRDGIVVRRVRLYDEPERASSADIVARLRAAVNARTTLVALTWVHSSTGVKLPVRAIADSIAELNLTRDEADRVLLCIDGVHGFGAEGTTPDQLGCDFLVSGCHKWLFGPRGTGLIWGRPQAWARFTPVIPSFTRDSIGAWLQGVDPTGPAGPAATPGGYHTFEHRWALAEAFALHQAIGPARIAQRTHELATALKQGLAGQSRVRVRTPASPDLSAGIVCCEIDGLAARDAVSRLRSAKVYASPTPYATSYLRFGTSILTSESDVAAALHAVRVL
jgi:selenocysteine lyase/cysteine desulfurase